MPRRQELISAKAHLAYPIRNGVPLMTAEAARSLDEPTSRQQISPAGQAAGQAMHRRKFVSES